MHSILPNSTTITTMNSSNITCSSQASITTNELSNYENYENYENNDKYLSPNSLNYNNNNNNIDKNNENFQSQQIQCLTKRAIIECLIRNDLLTMVSYSPKYWQQYIDALYESFKIAFDTYNVPPRLYLSALIYIERYIEQQGGCGDWDCLHLIIVSFMVSLKFWCDAIRFDTATFCELAGLTIQNICEIEIDFLETIEYSLLLTKKDFHQFLSNHFTYEPEPLTATILGDISNSTISQNEILLL
eukprot:TRINITY_DN2802_c0_g1_i1.p1 TRINITY_DN2802_c0_g1~~TRINITY_DN2802_c0_g1_i1.p1  ORF type:complete len:245 (-),score=104.46 TRINITY_DN2802_c0_g1_i1:192-926(-)